MRSDPFRMAWLFREAGMIDSDTYASFVERQQEQSKSLMDVLKQDVSLRSSRDLLGFSVRGLRDLMTMEIDLTFSPKESKESKRPQVGMIHDALSQPVYLTDDDIKTMVSASKPSAEELTAILGQAGVSAPQSKKAAEGSGRGNPIDRLIRSGLLTPRAVNRAVAGVTWPVKKMNRLQLALNLLRFNDVLSQSDCDEILKACEDKGEDRIPVLNDEIMAFIDSEPQIPEIDVAEIQPADTLRRAMPESFIRQNLVLPHRRNRGVLEIAVSDPFFLPLSDTLSLLMGTPVLAFAASAQRLISRINQLYGASPVAPAQPAMTRAGDTPAASADVSVDFPDQLIDSRSAVELVSTVVEGAIRHRATDIHLEPSAAGLRVRYRIDGRLRQIVEIPRALVLSIVSRIKVLANLDVTERRHPQDGHFSLAIANGAFDFRVSTLPTHQGEKTVIRVLDKSQVMHSLEDLGMLPVQCEEVRRWISRPHGLVLVTGPTGSGKTSTLYAALNTINAETKNIVTIEDPVEYRIEGINQVQVDANIELGFADGLRAILRQDPDVIMVGEVRDPETARIAMRAALTGHQVLSTLHTNTAVGAFATLGHMGIDSYTLVSAVSGVISQRLLRKLCPECRKAFTPGPEVLKSLRIEKAARKRMYRAKGCDECLNTGYRGRSGVFELLPMNDALAEGILSGKNEGDLVAVNRAKGFASMLSNVAARLQSGDTSPEEVLEVLLDEE
ncbi:type II/IV secretion system protein [Candidatus Sumerlaeota bacterium]|nr:type II/IV secretion system protein [Candidatus Sumerlaeota bacterium]